MLQDIFAPKCLFPMELLTQLEIVNGGARGAAVKNLSHNASLHAGENIAQSKLGTKHLGKFATVETYDFTSAAKPTDVDPSRPGCDRRAFIPTARYVN